VDPEAHRATGFQILATGHRGRSAEDTAEVIWCHRLHFELRGLSSSTACGYTNLWWTKVFDSSFYLHRGEDPRKTPAEVMDVNAHQATVLHRPPRKLPRKSFGATGSISSRGTWRGCLPLLWAPGDRSHMWPHMWPPHVAGHRVATNPKNSVSPTPQTLCRRSAEGHRGSHNLVKATGGEFCSSVI